MDTQERAMVTTDHVEQLNFALSADATIQTALAHNESISSEVQEVLLKYQSRNILEGLAGNPATVRETQLKLAEKGWSALNERLARSPLLCEDLQDRFMGMATLAGFMAGNPAMLPHHLRTMWEHYSDFGGINGVLVDLAQNPSLPPDVRSTFATSGNRFLRALVALNVNLPLAERTVLAQDRDAEVREQVARCPATTPDLVMRLARDESSSVRRTVARREGLPQEVYQQLSFDEDFQVAHDLTGNPAVEFTEAFAAKVVCLGSPALYEEWIQEGNREAAEALLRDWPGSLKDLVEASRLVTR